VKEEYKTIEVPMSDIMIRSLGLLLEGGMYGADIGDVARRLVEERMRQLLSENALRRVR
jgi:hypothetical protein